MYASKTFPLDANTHDRLAEACVYAKEYQLALRSYQTALSFDPDNQRIAEQINKLRSQK